MSFTISDILIIVAILFLVGAEYGCIKVEQKRASKELDEKDKVLREMRLEMTKMKAELEFCKETLKHR